MTTTRGTGRRVGVRALALGVAVLMALAAVASASEGPIPYPETAQRRHFSIFATPPEVPPPAIESSVRLALEGHGPPIADRGFNPALAQEAHPPGSKRSLWVIPGRSSILIAEVSAAGKRPYPKISGIAYSSTAKAIQRGLGIGVVPSHSIGLVPDGVIAVRLGEKLFAPVSENVFTAPGELESWFARWQFLYGAKATGD